jgi:small subunit ribosomal protein S12
MTTINQLIRNPRKIPKKYPQSILRGNPQRKAVCIKAITLEPKKPHSAQRRVVKIKLFNAHVKTDPYEKKVFTCKIPGEEHTLHPHAVILIRGGRVRDLPGIRIQAIRGKFDLYRIAARRKGRSKYGARNPQKYARYANNP